MDTVMNDTSEAAEASPKKGAGLNRVITLAVGFAIAVTVAIVVAVSVNQIRAQSTETSRNNAELKTELLAETRWAGRSSSARRTP
jgi:hypothetical protein